MLETLNVNMVEISMCVRTDGTEKPLPEGAELLSDNGVSLVYRGHDGWIYKRSTPFLTENEIYFLEKLSATGYVPTAVRYDKYTVAMSDLGTSQEVTDEEAFTDHCMAFLNILQITGIRHGDLTEYAVIVKKNRPFFIDWAEARCKYDPRPAKRLGGDQKWLKNTIQKLTSHLTTQDSR